MIDPREQQDMDLYDREQADFDERAAAQLEDAERLPEPLATAVAEYQGWMNDRAMDFAKAR